MAFRTMLKIVLALAGFVLLSIGLEGLYHLASSREQVPTTCAEFMRQRPRSVWVRVTGCQIDYVNAGFRESDGHLEELLFPVRPAGHPATEAAAIVAATSDPSVLAIAQNTIGGGRQPDQEQFLVMMLKVVTALRASREIEGVIRHGVVQRARASRLLAGLGSPVTPAAVLIDLHARPDAVTPAVVAGAGALAIATAMLLVVRGRRARRMTVGTPAVPESRPEATSPVPEVTSATQEVASSAPGTTPAPPDTPQAGPTDLDAATPRLRVLLLNLPLDAGVAAIETAPPLGDAGAVRTAILRQVPDMRFDDMHRGIAAGPLHTMTIDLGRHEVVHTAVVDVRGAAGIHALTALLAATRWRAYAPKAGSFVETDRLEEFAATS